MASFTPEQRTEILFDKYVNQVADEFLARGGMVIMLPDTSRSIRVRRAEPFGIDPESKLKKVGSRWNAMRSYNTGDVWNPKFINTIQSLVVSKDKAGVGACVRLYRAEYFDTARGVYVAELEVGNEQFGQSEPDIAKYLGLQVNQRSRLAFVDQTDALSLLK